MYRYRPALATPPPVMDPPIELMAPVASRIDFDVIPKDCTQIRLSGLEVMGDAVKLPLPPSWCATFADSILAYPDTLPRLWVLQTIAWADRRRLSTLGCLLAMQPPADLHLRTQIYQALEKMDAAAAVRPLMTTTNWLAPHDAAFDHWVRKKLMCTAEGRAAGAKVTVVVRCVDGTVLKLRAVDYGLLDVSPDVLSLIRAAAARP